ncbi:MAG: glycosyltransferase family 2 protein [Gammaproteobacteria bacterium]|nr:glycosyltransferase family 2 protein [Gammaproteobacteria bacterium]
MTPQHAGSRDVAVIMVNHNGGELLRAAVQAVLANRPGRLLLVDNASSDGSLRLLEDLLPADSIVSNAKNLGFAAACMQAAARCNQPYLLLLNPDCLLPAGALDALVDAMQTHPQYALLAPLVRDEHGDEQSGSRRRLPTPWRLLAYAAGRRDCMDLRQQPLPDEVQALPAVSGACMLLRQSAWQQVGGLDRGYFLHFEDLDLMLRLQQRNWLVGILPGLAVTHTGGHSSAGKSLFVARCKHRSLMRYLRRHHRWHPLTWTLLPVLNWGHYAWLWLRHRDRNGDVRT